MVEKKEAAAIESNFNLKNTMVELVPVSRSERHPFMSVEALEALRVGHRAVPASRHGLETICGASCETGAQ